MRVANVALQAAECDALRAQLAVTSQRMEEKAAAEGEIMVRNNATALVRLLVTCQHQP